MGGYEDSFLKNHGFLLSGGSYTTLDDPLGTGDTFAFGINNADQIVGYYVNATGSHGFLYDHQPEAQHPKSFSYPQERRPITPSLPTDTHRESGHRVGRSPMPSPVIRSGTRRSRMFLTAKGMRLPRCDA